MDIEIFFGKDILLLILGWLFGLLSPVIVSLILDKRETRAVQDSLFTELQELQYRLMLVIYRIKGKYGKLDKDFFQWAQTILVEYKGINSSEVLLKTIGPLLELSEEQMIDYVNLTKQNDKPNSGLELKKTALSLLDLDLKFLSKLNPVLRAHLLEVKTRIGFLNEIVDDSRYYFRLSFQDGISSENYKNADLNMVNSYNIYSTQAKITVDLITKILAKKC